MAAVKLAKKSDLDALEIRTDAVESTGVVAAVPTGVVATDTAAVLAAVVAAAGRPVVLRPGDYHVSLNFTDENIHITGPGRLVHQQADQAIYVERTLGAARSVTSVGTVQMGVDGGADTHFLTKLALAQADVADVVQGDLFFLSSEDAYPGNYLGDGTFTYQAAWFPVHGIGLNATGITGGGFAEGATITGATSGATALLLSVSTQQDGSRILVFGAFTGTFQNAENLQVGGTTRGVASGTPYLIMAGKLLDTPATAVKIRKADTTKKCIIDVEVVASGNVDSLVGTANRVAAIELRGVVDAHVDVKVQSAWNRAVQCVSCYRPDVNVWVVKLPNNAATTESAYGYAAEALGATENGNFKVNGRNLRHAFSTNCWGNTAYGFTVLYRTGVPKNNRVHDSVCFNPLAAGFDTHAGAYNTSLENCHTLGGGSGNRVSTGSMGFQNRAFGTTHRDCTARGCQVGFTDSAISFVAPFANTVRYINCHADRYQFRGFEQSQSTAADALTRHRYVGCDATGDPVTTSGVLYQTGFYTGAGDVEWSRCQSEKFNGAPFLIGGAPSRWAAIDCLADYSQSNPASATGIRFNGVPAQAALIGYRVRIDAANPTVPTGIIRCDTATSLTLQCDGVKQFGASASAQVPLTEVTGAGSLNLRPVAHQGGGTHRRVSTAVSYTVLVGESLIAVTSTAAARVITLPSAGKVGNGEKIVVKDESGAAGTNNITVTAPSGQTLDGVANPTGKPIAANYGAMTVYSNGSAWFTQ